MDNHGEAGVIQVGISRKLMMAERGGHLHEVLDGYGGFLRDRNLAMDMHQPCRAVPLRWQPRNGRLAAPVM
jgi:hypothetical protein